MRQRAAERDEVGDFPPDADGTLLTPDTTLQSAALAESRYGLELVVSRLGSRAQVIADRMMALLPQIGQGVVADDAAEAVANDDDPMVTMPDRVVVELAEKVECGGSNRMPDADVLRNRAQVARGIAHVLQPEV
jgi:hypothetical protein